MPYQPTFLSFAPTYRCNLRCAHCCIPIKSNAVLPLRVAHDCIDRAAALGIIGIGFTGGEPMLELAWAAEITRAARQRGMEVSDLSTNGVWWTERGELEAALLLLREAGFDAGFHLSVDAFHAGSGSEKQGEFVRAALAVFGRVGNLSCAETPERSALPALTRLARRLSGRVVEQNALTGRLVAETVELPYFRFPVADVGQRRRVGVSTGEEWFGDFDCFGGDSLYLDPQGKAHFCLGFATYLAPALCLGDVARDGLDAVVAAAQENPLIQLLCAEGPAGLRRVVEAREPHAFPRPWASPCAFCYHCLTDERALLALEVPGRETGASSR